MRLLFTFLSLAPRDRLQRGVRISVVLGLAGLGLAALGYVIERLSTRRGRVRRARSACARLGEAPEERRLPRGCVPLLEGSLHHRQTSIARKVELEEVDVLDDANRPNVRRVLFVLFCLICLAAAAAVGIGTFLLLERMLGS